MALLVPPRMKTAWIGRWVMAGSSVRQGIVPVPPRPDRGLDLDRPGRRTGELTRFASPRQTGSVSIA